MSGVESLLSSPSALASVAVVVVGALALWANPRRRINQFFFSASLHAALWLLCIGVAKSPLGGLQWVRISATVGALMPAHLWALKETIVSPFGEGGFRRGRLLIWIGSASILAILPLTEWFVPSDSPSGNRIYGIGYFIYVGGLLLSYGALGRDTLIRLRTQTGVARIELQIALLGGCTAAGLIIGLMALRSVLPVSSSVQPFVLLVFYTFTVVTITTHRIFDARHIVLVAAQKAVLLLVVALGAYFCWLISRFWMPKTPAFLLTVASMVALAIWFNERLDSWMRRYPHAVQARSAAYLAAQTEIRTEELRLRFIALLNGWGQTDRSCLLVGEGADLSGDGVHLTASSSELKALRELQWVTPERLVRERESPDRQCLASFMKSQRFGALIFSSGPTLSVVLGIGVRPSRRPFTFPEIGQLRELASIFESSLSRTQLLAKAQRAEQLATVGLLGAGVAHEIRNPLVSIKTFAQLLPKHYSDPNFRERFSRLIGEEVARIDRLTEQLLDLAAPRNYRIVPMGLHEVVQASLDLVTARSTKRAVQFSTLFTARPDSVRSDPNALKQVIINLCFNAVQAQDNNPEDRPARVRIETRATAEGIELLVADNGPGVPLEARAHLFEAFHSTKSTGFGLGLTVCGEIVSSLGASISLDPFDPTTGAVFRVLLPCPPPSS